MNGVILTWNPSKWSPRPGQIEDLESLTAQGVEVDGDWSVGNHKNGYERGMPVFLLRQGDHRGIIASGWMIDGPYEGGHWNGGGSSTMYIDLVHN
jgi:hypothetical protein